MNRSSDQSWFQLLTIQGGGALCLPVIMLGEVLFRFYGWGSAFIGILLGNGFLLLLALGFASLSKERCTAEHLIYYLGEKGKRGFVSLLILSMVVWFAVQLNLMSMSLQQMFFSLKCPVNLIFLNCVLGVILSGAMCLGMKMVKKVSNLCVPLLVGTLFYVLFSAKGTPPSFSFSSLGGVALVIGGGIVSVMDLPTFFQHARSKKDALLAALLLYGILLPFIEGVGLYLAATTSGHSLLEIFQVGHGFLWALWIAIFVFLCGFTTNNGNLYSAARSSYALTPRIGFKLRVIILGGLGTGFACLNPLKNLPLILELLGMMVGSMGALIFTGYLIEKAKYRNFTNISFFSWNFAVLSSLLFFLFDFTFTGVSALDAFALAGGSHLVLTLPKQRRVPYEEVDKS